MDKLQKEIKQKFEDFSIEEKIQYLEDSIKFHRDIAHYHLYMERTFAKQKEAIESDQNEADSAPALAQQAEAEPHPAGASEAEYSEA